MSGKVPVRSESPTENENMEQDEEGRHRFSPAKLATWTKTLMKVDTSERPESEACLVPKTRNPTRFITPVRFLMVFLSKLGYSYCCHPL